MAEWESVLRERDEQQRAAVLALPVVPLRWHGRVTAAEDGDVLLSCRCPGTGGVSSYLRQARSQPASPAAASSPLTASARHGWAIERTVAWLNGFRRLHRRYEYKAGHFAVFAGIAAALICYRRLSRQT